MEAGTLSDFNRGNSEREGKDLSLRTISPNAGPPSTRISESGPRRNASLSLSSFSF